MSQLSNSIRAAVEQANKAYEEAGKSLEQIDALLTLALTGNDALTRMDVKEIKVQVSQSVALTYDIKHDLEVLEADLQALENVRGK